MSIVDVAVTLVELRDVPANVGVDTGGVVEVQYLPQLVAKPHLSSVDVHSGVPGVAIDIEIRFC
ncbi:hypothetical protein [Halalkalicoccus salilacus]|uniref:hypothetical protein n=1 Tax=Halalkalicoccus sp. GCM10025704 TaxID=3252662 RepID=UPI003621D5D2